METNDTGGAFLLDQANRLPPQLLADLRLVWTGMGDPHNPSHQMLRQLKEENPGKFLDQMTGLEKAYQGQIGRQRKESPAKEPVGAEDPVADVKEAKTKGLIKRLLDHAESRVAQEMQAPTLVPGQPCPTCGQEVSGPDVKEEKVKDLIERLRKEWDDEQGGE